MRPILCVIDLCESSAKVLEVAARMAYAYKSPLVILFPYRLIDYGYKAEASILKARLEQNARDKFLTLQKEIGLLEQLSFEFKPEIGFPASVINSHLKRNKIDTIVIGQRQANAINEVNGVALQHLIASSRLPFTIVPEDSDVEILSY